MPRVSRVENGEAIAPWQNERFLGELERAYAGAAQVLRRRGRVELLEVEEPLVAPAEIAERVEVSCFRVLLEAGKLTASP